MKTRHALLLAAGLGLATPAPAANSEYDLFIVACDTSSCKKVAEQTVTGSEYNRNGVKLMLETLARRTDEEDTRISLDVRPAGENAKNWRPSSAALAQRIETFVVTLGRGAFRPLTTFVSEGTTYQVWARLAAMR